MSDHLPADLEFWDKQELLTVTEIAWLWCGFEPPRQGRMYWKSEGPPQRPPDPPLSRAEIVIHELFSDANNPDDPLERVFYHPDQVIGHSVFFRVDLRAWAKRKGHKPLFLFPELRPTNQSGVSLDGALLVIAALAKALDPRWEPGKAAPHSMAKRIVTTAETLGLRLDRNTVGKYLKEAGNKIKSA